MGWQKTFQEILSGPLTATKVSVNLSALELRQAAVSQSPAELTQKNIEGAVDTKKLCVIFSLDIVSKGFVLFETKNVENRVDE